jgi:hypothetical protein
MNHGLFGATLALAMLAGAAARADTELADKATGAVYVLTAGEDGAAVLASKADGEMDSYKLTANCYAEHPIYGLGAWQAVEGGWRIMVGGTQIVSFNGATPLDNPACVPQ